MEVYLEYVIIDNLIINYLLLKVSVNLARLKSSVLRLITASVLGTAVAVVVPLIKMPNLVLFLVKILLGLSMTLIVSGGNGLSKIASVFGFFILFTALSGGAVIMIFYFAGVDYKVYFSLNYNSFIPIGITFLIVFILSKLTIKWVGGILKSRDIRPFIRKCVLISNGKKVVATGFIDSGNLLTDVDSGLPIIVASATLSRKLEDQKLFKIPIKSVAFSTVSGDSKMKVYILDKLMVYDGVSAHIYKRVFVARGIIDFEKGGDYDILLSPSMF